MKNWAYISVLLLIFAVSDSAFSQTRKKVSGTKTGAHAIHRRSDNSVIMKKDRADSDSVKMDLKPPSPTLPSPNNPNPHNPEPNPVNPNRPVVPDTIANPVPGGPVKPADGTQKQTTDSL